MPLYEYRCHNCQTDNEILVRSRREKVRCPRCDSSKLVKQLSVFAAAKDLAEPAMPACSANPRSCGRCAT